MPLFWLMKIPLIPVGMGSTLLLWLLQSYPLKATRFFFLQEINKVQEKKYISNSQCVDKSISKNQSVNSVASMSISRSVKRNQSPLLLLGCGTVEILLNKFTSRINGAGRLAHPSVGRNWEGVAFLKSRCSLFFCLFFVGTITRHYLCDILWLVSCL